MSMKAKARMLSGDAEVKLLIKHPMETGQRKDSKTGKLIPAHFVQEVICSYKGKEMFRAHWGPAISKNPYLSFKLKGPRSGEALTFAWKDNQGGSGEQVVNIA